MAKRKIELVIRDYVKRMFSLFELNEGCSTDEGIDCPKCGSYRAITWRRDAWACGYACGFTFSAESTPPSPEALEDFWKERKKQMERQRVAALLTALDIYPDSLEKQCRQKRKKRDNARAEIARVSRIYI